MATDAFDRGASLAPGGSVKYLAGVFFLLILATGSATAAEDDLVKQARNLLGSGKAKEAYTLLLPHQSERAGDPDYDLQLGIAALDSGKPNEAIFALERVLATNPDNLPARAEIGRAYFASGEVAMASQELEAVQKQQPPAELQITVQKYLDAIAKSRSAEKTTLRGYIEVMVGDDSNVNSATASDAVAIPAYGGEVSPLDPSGVRRHDTFTGLAAGFSVRHAVSQEWAVFGGANISQRMNTSEDTFNTGSLDGNLGASLTQGDSTWSGSIQLHEFDVDNRRYRQVAGVTAQWLRALDSRSQTNVYLQYAGLTYPGQEIRDADRYVLGVAYAHILANAYSPVVYVGGYVGQERERKGGFPYLGHELFGVRVGGEMKINPQTTLFGSASLEDRRYGGQEPLFLVGRGDTQTDLRLGFSYIPFRSWTITPQLSVTRNDSNIIINEYDRTVFSVSLRRDFN